MKSDKEDFKWVHTDEIIDDFNEKMGIYAIFSRSSGKVYIGSTINLKGRLVSHSCRLRKGKNTIHLQAAFDKYGWDNFKFIVLEVVDDVNDLLATEQWYIDHYKSYLPENGYNIARSTNPCEGNLKFKKEGREKKKRKSRLKHSGYGKGEMSAEVREAGRMKMKITKEYKFISPEGILHEGKGLNKFCREQGLVSSSMLNLLNGITKQHKGWTLAEPCENPKSWNDQAYVYRRKNKTSNINKLSHE